MLSVSLRSVFFVAVIPICVLIYEGMYVYHNSSQSNHVPVVEVRDAAPSFQSTITRVNPGAGRKTIRNHTGLCLNSTFTHIYPGGPKLLDKPEFSETPRIIYLFWCSHATKRSSFEFRHFLSVKSAIYFLNPDIVFLYYDKYPQIDIHWYNTWLMELQTIYPFIVTREVTPNSSRPMCSTQDGEPNMAFVAEEINKTGGVFIREHIMLTAPLPGLLTGIPSAAKSSDDMVALASGKQGYDFQPVLNQPTKMKHRFSRCHTMESFANRKPEDGFCLDLGTDIIIYPKDLLCCEDTEFKRLAKVMLYGHPDTPVPQVHDSEIVPRLGHYCFFGGKDMSYLFYLSILSCIHVIKLDVVYIHGDISPTGYYWGLLQDGAYKGKVRWIKRYKPITMFGSEMRATAHKADVTCADVMLKYGGVHVDPDVLFIRPFDPILWRYETVFGYSCCKRDPFPEQFAWGLALAAPDSKFYRLIKKSQRCFVWNEWDWNSQRIIYKMYERNPQYLLALKSLQIICTKQCYTLHLNDPETGDATNSNATGWLNKINAIHLTGHGQAFQNPKSARTDVTIHGAIARLVMKAAGIL